MGNFYLAKSDEWYFGEFWKGERDALQVENAYLLTRDEANKLTIEELLDKSSEDIKPRLNKSFGYFAMPYELDDEVLFEGNKIAETIVNLINNNLNEEKYFASTDSDKCCVIKTDLFCEDIFWSAASGHLNTPFIVFDESKRFFALLDYDLPIQIIGYKDNILEHDLVKKWKGYFQQEWPKVQKKYKSYTAINSIVSEYYNFVM